MNDYIAWTVIGLAWVFIATPALVAMVDNSNSTTYLEAIKEGLGL